MGDRLEGQVAVITGGASGMGRDTVLRFLDEGARVVVADLNEGTGKETLELAEARGAGDRVLFQRVDVASEADVKSMIELAVERFGKLDCLFNNAGIGGAVGPLLDTEVDDWDFTFAVLLRSVFLGIKHGGRAMRERGEGGSIINTASVAGLSGGGGPPAYSAAKAGVINLSKSAALQLAPDRIRVNAICPGAILTPLIHRGFPDAMRPHFEKMQPWPEAGEGTHIAGAALFLASEDARFVTGEEIVVDGGLTAAGPRVRASQEQGGERGEGETPRRGLFNFTGVDMGSTGRDAIVRKRDD